MRGLSSLESAAAKSIDSLSPEQRADYHFELFRELTQSLLSSDEIDKTLDKSRLDITRGLDTKEKLDCISSILIKFAYFEQSAYLNERINHLNAVQALAESHIFYSKILLEKVPDLSDKESAALIDTINKFTPRIENLQQMINEIISLDDWRLIEENTGCTCRAEALS